MVSQSLPIIVGELVGLAFWLTLVTRVWTSGRLRHRSLRRAWAALTLALPLIGFLAFLFLVEYRRDPRLQSN